MTQGSEVSLTPGGPLFFGDAEPLIGLVDADVRQVVVFLAADGATIGHGCLLQPLTLTERRHRCKASGKVVGRRGYILSKHSGAGPSAARGAGPTDSKLGTRTAVQ